MNYLLDSHVLLWTVFDETHFPAAVQTVLRNPESNVFVSAVTFWELALKYRLGKLRFTGFDPAGLPEVCRRLNFKEIPLSTQEAATFHTLEADYHRDFFDRMLIHQALSNRFILVSKDQSVHRYASIELKVFWE